jgi:histidinol-phosphate aminotransferase
MKSFEDYVVPWVKNSESYSAKHMDIAWENPDVLRMMSNENLVPPNEKVIAALTQAARQGNLYPGSAPELRKKLGEKAGLTGENVVLGNGSTDVINFVISTFVAPGDEVILPEPTFSMYKSRVLINGGIPVIIPTHAEHKFHIQNMIGAITDKTKLIFLCSPNNPTGNITLEGDLIEVLEQGIPTFFDEAYYELQDEVVTRAGLIERYPHLMINRTFSKAYGLAGFRLGYVLCDERLANYFNRVKIPWNVSLPTIAAALAQLDDEADLERKRKVVIDGRLYIQEEINKMPGIYAYPSQGNFVLIDAGILDKTALELRDLMVKKGIFIRPMSGYFIGKGFFRVTVGQKEVNEKFIRAFSELVEEINKEK